MKKWLTYSIFTAFSLTIVMSTQLSNVFAATFYNLPMTYNGATYNQTNIPGDKTILASLSPNNLSSGTNYYIAGGYQANSAPDLVPNYSDGTTGPMITMQGNNDIYIVPSGKTIVSFTVSDPNGHLLKSGMFLCKWI